MPIISVNRDKVFAFFMEDILTCRCRKSTINATSSNPQLVKYCSLVSKTVRSVRLDFQSKACK